MRNELKEDSDVTVYSPLVFHFIHFRFHFFYSPAHCQVINFVSFLGWQNVSQFKLVFFVVVIFVLATWRLTAQVIHNFIVETFKQQLTKMYVISKMSFKFMNSIVTIKWSQMQPCRFKMETKKKKNKIGLNHHELWICLLIVA